MQRMLIKAVLESETSADEVVICGWIKTRRDGKGVTFLELNDGSCLTNIQCVVDPGTEAAEGLGEHSTGASVCVRGALVPSPGKGQRWEIHAKQVEVFGGADPETYPLQKKRHSDEFLRTIAHLRTRTNKYSAVFRIRSNAAYAIHKFMHEQGFFQVHCPILTGSDCEGAGEMFRVTSLPPGEKDLSKDFFGKVCNLTVSGQLEAEALALGLGKVYSFGPTFRAENSNTSRHAAEFIMLEPEMAFADLSDIMVLAEDLIHNVTSSLLASNEADIALLDRFVEKGLIEKLKVVAEVPFAHIPYGEAIEILLKAKKTFEYPVTYGIDLQSEHERYLTEEYAQKPVIVTDYPKNIKAFYMRSNEGGDTVAAMDILIPRIGELVGGSQREERLDYLEHRLIELGQQLSSYDWYLDLRRYGTVPHAGFGLGFERLIMMLTGVTNIRDVIPFPRTPGNLEF